MYIIKLEEEKKQGSILNEILNKFGKNVNNSVIFFFVQKITNYLILDNNIRNVTPEFQSCSSHHEPGTQSDKQTSITKI